MAFKDWMNNLRDYFVEDEEEFDEPVRPVQESKPTVVSTPKPKVEERTMPKGASQSRTTSSTTRTQTQTVAPKRTVSNFSKPMPEKIVQQASATQAQSLASAVSTIAIKEPRAYADIMEAARIVKNGESVLVNFKFMGDAQARRSIDFMTGVVFTLDGDIQNVGGQIFLMTPANITVDAAKEMSILAGQNFESYDLY
ncbi:cell division protein SepF [Lactococcus protaetiae]|uniref:Cell division protein SepF n=1 Tax=Lactococcus protaetiae TaxID=2592653 RepID=A0A514ZBA0_9LACT|nr:cell division protein SepF [Lactococcus protaetiae]MCL2113916.1 cell division protein SepF [Streptococcaceae bacterium]QDK71848.1 cell division protein SepF [Lactococcus protaetiae]